MKIQAYIAIMCFGFILISRISFAQNNTNDSLQKQLRIEKEDTNKVNTLNAISLNLFQNNDTLNAMLFAKRALSLAKKLDFLKGEGNAYYYIALFYQTYYKYSEALVNFFNSIKIQEQIGDKHGSGDSYQSIAIIYMSCENDPKALEMFYKSLNFYENSGDKTSAAYSLQMIGTIYCSQANDSEGLKNYLASFKLYKEAGDKFGIALSHCNIGLIYFRQGRFQESLKEEFYALGMYNGTGDWIPGWGISYCDANIGDIYERQAEIAYATGEKRASEKRFAEALSKYLEALSVEKKTGNFRALSITYNQLGKIYIKLKKFSVAKFYFEKSIQSSGSSKVSLRDVYSSFSTLDSIEGNYNDAYSHFKKYILYRDSLINEESGKKILQSSMQYEFDKKEIVAKAEQDKKDADAKRIKNQQYFAIAGLAVIMFTILIIALIQFRNNKQKQKANLLLERQKQKVETTLLELKSTQSQLIQSEKMASLGELTAGIAHEIQNPLNFVNNFSEVNKELVDELQGELKSGNMEEAMAISNDIKENEGKINHHGKRADAIVKGMLQHSRSSAGQKELTDINALADEYLRLSYHGLRAKDNSFNATMKTDFDHSIGKINIIPQDIGRVLLNIFNNAFYAVNEKMKMADLNYQPTVSVQTKKINDKVILRVTDNGNGIPQKAVDKIFQPFFTTKPTGQGTGLGLSLSYDIIKAHGGEIKVNTKENEECEFIIELPVK